MFKKIGRVFGLKEKVFIPEILRGLYVTNKHFWQNIFSPLTKRSFTVQYPEVTRAIAPRWRGRHRLTLRADGLPKCVACMCCSTNCPAHCIHITPAEPLPLNPIKYPREFVVDYMRCIMCGLCVEACPYDALYMDTQIVSLCSHVPNLYLDKFMLLDDQPYPEHQLPTHLPQWTLDDNEQRSMKVDLTVRLSSDRRPADPVSAPPPQ